MDEEFSIVLPGKFIQDAGLHKEIATWLDERDLPYTVGTDGVQFSIIFPEANSAILFRLRMGHWEDSLPEVYVPNVFLPIIRRVMPSVIAHDILGVQPMTGAPLGLITALRARYADDSEEE